METGFQRRSHPLTIGGRGGIRFTGISKSTFLVAFLFLFSSCATTSDFGPDKLPKYEGVVNPISIPIKPSYAPAISVFSLRVKARQTNSFRTYSMSMYGKTDVSKVEDRLFWDWEINKVSQNGSSFNPNEPIVTCKSYTDPYGKIKGFEISFPALEKRNKAPKIGTPEYQSFMDSMKKMAPPLSNKEIISGDIIQRIPIVLDIGEGENRIYMNITEKEGIYYDVVLKGSSYYRGKEVLLGEIAFSEGPIALNGYQLYDPQSLQVLKSEWFLSIKINDDVTAYANVNFHAEVTNKDEMVQ